MKKFIIFFCLLLQLNVFAKDSDLSKAVNYDISKEFKSDIKKWDISIDKENYTIQFNNIKQFYKNAYKFYTRYIHTVLKYKKYIVSIEIDVSKNNKPMVLKYLQSIENEEIFKNETFLDNIIKLQEDDTISGIKFKVILKDVSDEQLEEDNDKTEGMDIPKVYIDDTFIKVKQKKANDPITKQKLTLRDYVIDVLVSNPTINEKYEYVMSLEKDIIKAKSALLPKVDVNYGYTHYESYRSSTDPRTKDKSLRKDITVRYNIYDGHKNRNNVGIKTSYYEANRFTKLQVEDETIYKVVDAYITLQKTLYLYDLSRQNYMDYMDFAQKAEFQFQNGAISLKNYSKIQARVITRYVNFEEDTKRYSDAITTIQRYIDFDDSYIDKLKMPNPQSKYFDNLLLALEDCKKISPYVKEANANVELYKRKMLNAKNIFAPSVDLVATKSVTSDFYDGNPSEKTKDFSFAFTGKLNLYNGESDSADYKMKIHDYRSKLHKRDSVIKDTIYNVDMDFNKLVLQEAKQSFFKELVERRTQEYKAAKYDYKFAKIDANGLLDELDSLYNAQRQFAENEFDIIITKYKILKDIGVIKDHIVNDEE